MAKTYKSVTQQVWQRIAATPHAVHSILTMKNGPAHIAAVSRVPGSGEVKPQIRKRTLSITQEEFGHLVAEATLFLQSKGLQRGDRLAILGWDSLYWSALARAGAGMGLIIAPPHPNSTKEQNVHVLNDSQPSLLVGESQKMIDNLIDLTQFKRVRLVNEEVAEDQSGLDDNLETSTFIEVFRHVPAWAQVPEGNRDPAWNDVQRPELFRAEAVAEFKRLKELFTTPGAQLPFEMNDVNILIYTSGSTGLPKGAKHTHNSEAAICERLAKKLAYFKRNSLSYLPFVGRFIPPKKHLFGPEQIIMHMLPWSHIFGKGNGKALAAVLGTVNAYSDPVNFKDDLAIVRPHLFLSVPLLWNRLKNEIEKMVSGADDLALMLKAMKFKAFKKSNSEALKLAAAKWALDVRDWSEYKDPASAGDGFFKRCLKRIGGRIAHAPKAAVRWLARTFVVPGITKKAGLDQIIMSVSGSAAIPTSTTKFFHYLKIMLLEGYGSTETGGGWCVNLLDDFEMGSLGLPLDDIELRLIPVEGMPEGTGELEVRGDFVFAGYWRNPAKTAEVLSADGWYKMGDTVRIDAHGRLWFEGRGAIKKLLTGEFYSEERVQTALEGFPLFDAAVPTGEGFSCIGALLFLDPSTAKRIAGTPADGMDEWEYWEQHDEIQRACKEGVALANKALSEDPNAPKWEQVRRHRICRGRLTIENGLRTNTNKPKNPAVRKAYAEDVDKMNA